MAKKSNSDLFSEGFEIESEDGNDKTTDSDFENNQSDGGLGGLAVEPIESHNYSVKTVKTPPISEADSKVVDGISQYKEKSIEIVRRVEKIVIILNDDENKLARTIGKEMKDLAAEIKKATKEKNRPLEEQVDENKNASKKLIEPIDRHVDRLNKLISNYESEKEKLRQAEVKRLDEEKRKREEEEAKNKERIIKIRSTINQIKEQTRNVLMGDDLPSIRAFETKLKSATPKKDFYAEFYSEVVEVLKQCLEDITVKIPVLEDIEKNNEEATRLEGVDKEQKKKEIELKERELALQKEEEARKEAMRLMEEENAESIAVQQLITLAATLDVDQPSEFIEELERVYGNSRTAIQNKDKIIADHFKKKEQDDKAKVLEGEKVKNQRKNYLFKIVDESKVPREFLCVDEQKIRKALVENRAILDKDITSFRIDGVHVYTEVTTVFKK